MNAETNRQFEYDIFLSYNHADKEWVRQLAIRIEREIWQGRRMRVFFDEWHIQPGENIPIALERALPGSRKIGIILSPHASQSAWVELERSVVTLLDPGNRQRRIIPLFLSGATGDIPPLVAPLKYIDFRKGSECFEERFSDLLCALREESVLRSDPAPAVSQ